MPEFDHTPDRERRAEILTGARIGWFGTVRADGRPHLVPVWFYWTRGKLLITAEPKSQKVVNARANPRITFAVDDSHDGHEAILLEGQAQIGTVTAFDPDLDAYYDKYRETMDRMMWPEDEARTSHSALILVQIDRFVSF